MNNVNPYNEEFENPGKFFDMTYGELRKKIEALRLDTIQANDPEVKAFAEKKYLEYRIEYFKLLNQDLELQKLYEEEEVNENG